MGEIAKFMFETWFEGAPAPAEPATDAEEELASEESAPPPRFSEQELEAARESGFAAGLAQGLDQARNSIEQQTAVTLSMLEEHLAALERGEQAARHASIQDVVTLARAMATKIAGDLIARAPQTIVETVITDSLQRLYGETEIVLRVNNDLVAPIEARLDGIRAACGFVGQVSVVGDSQLGLADCRVEWSDGAAHRDTESIWRDIFATIDRFVIDDAPDAAGTMADATAPASDVTEGTGPDGAGPVADEDEATPPPEADEAIPPPETDEATPPPEADESESAEAVDDTNEAQVAAAAPTRLADVLGPELEQARTQAQFADGTTAEPSDAHDPDDTGAP
jgi:flagellar biosynthesis/type III secretory pathway protein FliH